MSRATPFVLGALALACSSTHPAPTPPARGPGVQAAEATIRPDDAKRDVEWLAAPEREGRGVGTPGIAAAADFIAARMRKLGLVPAENRSFFQTFDAPFEAVLRADNALELGGTTLGLRSGWQPFTFSDNGRTRADLVFAGYGITAPALGYDDYAGLDVKGKAVLVAADFPREKDPDSPFRDPRAYAYGEWRYKAMNARDHGAAAIIAVRDDWHHPGPDELPPWRGQVSSRAGILAARVTAATLRAAGIDAAALARPGDEDGRPHSRALAVMVSLSVDVEQRHTPTSNVLGLFPGTDPARAAECVVVGAHYDHLGLGGESSLAPNEYGKVHPGADDNASGTSALLEIARAFAATGPLPRTVLFAAFTGEEMGLLGSAELVKHPPAACPIDRMQLMVNLDMVGRPRNGKVYVFGADTAKGMRPWVKELPSRSPALSLDLNFGGGGDGYGPSDQTSFYAKGVPVLYLFTGAHADYHRPSDTPDKIDAAGLAAVAKLAYRAALDAARAPGRLEVVRAAAPPGAMPGASERSRGYGPYLGTVPDFSERDEPGVLLSGVRSGSPAEKAGLAAGDVLVELGGQKIQNLQDLTYALRAHRPGDAVKVVFKRGGETRAAQVTLEERR